MMSRRLDDKILKHIANKTIMIRFIPFPSLSEHSGSEAARSAVRCNRLLCVILSFYRLRARMSFLTTDDLSWRDDCQQRKTFQPCDRRVLFILRSRIWFPNIFAFQYVTFDFGTRNDLGFPCQKSPSINTITRLAGKTKSGFPGRCIPRRQPVILFFRSIPTNRSSVAAFPRLRMRDMIRERS
jgi:hypothetical protein